MDNYYSQSDLEDLLDAIPIALWLKNNNGQYIYVNKHFCDSVQLSKEEILGKKRSELNTDYTNLFFDKSDEEILNDDIEHLGENEILINNTSKWIKSFRSSITRSSCNEKATVGIFNDISSQKNNSINKYLKLENELQLFLDTATDLYCILNYDGTFEKVNSKFFKYLGWSDNELYKMKYDELIHPDDYNNSLLCRLNSEDSDIHKGYGLINRYRCKNGEYKYLCWNWSRMVSGEHIIMTAKDITNEIQLKHERDKFKKNYELETLKTNFFANISHEFRTPINIILTTIQLLSVMDTNKNFNTEKLKKYCRGIQQNSYRLLRLVNNLLEITKIDQGYCDIHLINCNIVELIENISLSVAEHIEPQKRQIIFDTTEEEIITACDPDKIETIMLNLLSNSIKFTQDGGLIEINVSHDYIHNRIKVSVKDNGKTIDPEHSKTIFKPFTQIDELLNRPCEGSGLGLALVKSLVDAHNGEVWVNTNYKDGAEIIFTLPIKQCSDNISPYTSKTLNANIEKYNVEFSDIYNLN